ncbi:hypothetical protein GCM10017786_51550 [Amycolatopsis deserti]|uniref:Transposase n=1 Tax=Amycolatopsis deserti TaxID=185696 RepID=A0ABQ3JAY4_9PSEU|nr:hypothetical protein GCM10017786_51550 [Amycolatopsis deserti]
MSRVVASFAHRTSPRGAGYDPRAAASVLLYRFLVIKLEMAIFREIELWPMIRRPVPYVTGQSLATL